MITADAFMAEWTIEGDELVQYPEAAIQQIPIPQQDALFLVKAGLPASAAPFLSFETTRATLKSVREVWDLSAEYAGRRDDPVDERQRVSDAGEPRRQEAGHADRL